MIPFTEYRFSIKITGYKLNGSNEGERKHGGLIIYYEVKVFGIMEDEKENLNVGGQMETFHRLNIIGTECFMENAKYGIVMDNYGSMIFCFMVMLNVKVKYGTVMDRFVNMASK